MSDKPHDNKLASGSRTGVSRRVWMALAVAGVANAAAHLAVMPSLPARIPMHWGADGAVNAWGPQWTASALGVLPLVLLVLFALVPRMDPKGEAYAKSGRFYSGFVIAFTLMMGAISWMPELSVWGLLPAGGTMNALIFGAVGLLLMGMGNYLPRVKQNRTLGIKTPWALADPENWRRTNRFGGACMMAMGLVAIVVGLVGAWLPEVVAVGLFLACVLGGTAAMYAYSYLLWRKK